jgi:hypothetical protein
MPHPKGMQKLATSQNKFPMKNKIKFFIKSYFIFLFLIIISCGDECGSYPNKYKVSSLNSEALQITILNENYQITLSGIENKSVDYKKYAIKMSAKMTSFYAYERKSIKNIFIESAYACSPVEPTTNEKITNIEIFANNDYANQGLKKTQKERNFFQIIRLLG